MACYSPTRPLSVRDMYITITFQTSSGIIRASALVDSGCYAMFIDQDFANKHRIKYPKPATSSGCAVDGTRLSYSVQGTHKICAYDHNNRLSRNRFNFQVLKNCPDAVVLGMPFLNKINPQIDWVKKTWHLPEQKATKPVKLIESEHMAEQKTIEPLQTIEPAKMTETKRKILVPKPRMLTGGFEPRPKTKRPPAQPKMAVPKATPTPSALKRKRRVQEEDPEWVPENQRRRRK